MKFRRSACATHETGAAPFDPSHAIDRSRSARPDIARTAFPTWRDEINERASQRVADVRISPGVAVEWSEGPRCCRMRSGNSAPIVNVRDRTLRATEEGRYRRMLVADSCGIMRAPHSVAVRLVPGARMPA